MILSHPITSLQLQFWLLQRYYLLSELRLGSVVVSRSPYVGVVLRASGKHVGVMGTFPSLRGIFLHLFTFGLAWLFYFRGKQMAMEAEINDWLANDFGSGKRT